MSVSLSANTRAGLTVLRNVADQMSTTQNRLVTGKAVNSPLDNVSKFFTASSMDSRAASIDALMDNINSAKSSMKAASEGIKGIQGLIKEARSLTSQALTSSATTGQVTGSTNLTNGTTFASMGFEAADTVTVSDGTTTATFTTAAGTDVEDFITAVNGTANLNVKASLDDSGKLKLENVKGGNVVIGGAADADELGALGVAAGTTNGTANATRTSLAKQFDALRSEIDRIAKDAGINGTNLLAGDKIKLALNENGSSSTTIEGTAVSASSLNIEEAADSWQSDTAVNDALSSLIDAADSLQATAASFSSNKSIIDARADFNASLSDILKAGSSDLTAADMDQEAANLMALQTRQQMATTSLSIMRSAETTALSLLR
ncbi:flagellin [Devosia equisanguinis]|uniref:Flagellin n=1 Tax=Devosia equisanguinis TaxID=2490941 RepID=A0A3S4CEU0_9HYPH|nr:flagellin [Devosia equisanguinis]VDS06430.1 flagellin [Devosia equisanguinis]